MLSSGNNQLKSSLEAFGRFNIHWDEANGHGGDAFTRVNGGD